MFFRTPLSPLAHSVGKNQTVVILPLDEPVEHHGGILLRLAVGPDVFVNRVDGLTIDLPKHVSFHVDTLAVINQECLSILLTNLSPSKGMA